MSSGSEAVSRLFRSTYGSVPTALWRAPGRVNLIGEHTDYNDGFVLPFAIDRATTIALSPRDDQRIRLISTVDGALVQSDLASVGRRRFSGWSSYPLGVVWALGERCPDATQHGFDLAVDSDVPIGAGLSSSAAIEMAVAAALEHLWDLGLQRVDLARVGQRAENIAVGAPTGIMDQVASLFGQRSAAVFLDCRTLAVEQVPLDLDEADLALMIVDTRVEHSHATGGYRDRRDACERGARAMGVPALRDLSIADLPSARRRLDDVAYRRVKHVITEDLRVLDGVAALRQRDFHRFGELMHDSHLSMRDDFEISVPQLDAVVETALQSGALGARMTGGGFGGCAIALVPHSRIETITNGIRERFAENGWTAPSVLRARPSGGAAPLPPDASE